MYFLWLESLVIEFILKHGKDSRVNPLVIMPTAYTCSNESFFCKLFVKYCLIVITVYGNKQVKKTLFPPAAEIVPDWPLISVSSWQQQSLGQIIWFGWMSGTRRLGGLHSFPLEIFHWWLDQCRHWWVKYRRWLGNCLILTGTLDNPMYTEVHTGRKNRKMGAISHTECQQRNFFSYKVILLPAPPPLVAL